MNFGKQFKEGLITQNPVLVQLLGMCSTMAITTSFFNGLGMGISVLIILTLSNIFIALLRKIIPNEVRIACFIVVIAGFVTCVDLLLKAFVPALSNSLGVFIPLIVVNCIILGRAEGFASKNGIGASAVDGICQGVGYTLVLIVMCVVRELLGSGKFAAAQQAAAELAGRRRTGQRARHRHLPRGIRHQAADPAGGRLPDPGRSHRCDAVGPGQERKEKGGQVSYVCYDSARHLPWRYSDQ